MAVAGENGKGIDPGAVTRYLHSEIPLSQQMGVRVEAVEPGRVRLAAPLEPNLNHKSTAFGGSISALAILAGWALVHTRSLSASLEGDIVIRSNEIAYLAAATGQLGAEAVLADEPAWTKWEARLSRRRTARIDVDIVVVSAGRTCARMRAEYVAIPRRSAD